MDKKDDLKSSADLKKVGEHLKKEYGIGIIDFFNYLRSEYLKEELRKDPRLKAHLERVLRRPIDEAITAVPLSNEQKHGLESFVSAHDIDWANPAFHIHNRATEIDELVLIFPDYYDGKDARNVVEQGYDLSVMPLNISINNKELLHKFLPKGDFFTNHNAKKTDPYGIFGKGSIINKEGVYVGSQKFPRSLLMNITNACPFGCVGCYKGEYTRTKDVDFFTNLEKATSTQTNKLVEHLNENQEIEAVIMSGGEPLLLPNRGMKKILDRLKDSKYLTEFRVCTGTIFQGLPQRIDNELLGYLKDFQDETGIQVHFNAHLSHPSQFTPEALIAIRKIKEKGFYINTQVPLQRGVNVFIEEDIESSRQKTLDTLYELTRLQGASGIRPYKYILHMNCGSLEYSIPLEFMLEVIGELKYRPDHPWPETWQPVSMSILCKEGNILLSPQLLYCMEKLIDEKEGYVEYKIPVPVDGSFKTTTYREPIIRGYNDNPNSLNKYKILENDKNEL